MASWLDRLRPASFRGVPFGVAETGYSGGRRVGVHEFPLRDSPLVEEMGRLARTFTVEAYLVGDDYAERLERLVARLEGASAGFPHKPGGTLVHPTRGQIEVLCTRFQVRETTDEGRMARVSIEFTEAGREIQPFGAVDPVGSSDRAASASSAASGAAYQDTVETSGVLQEALDAIADVALDAAARLRRLDVFSGNLRSVEALEDALSSLVRSISELVTAPADLVGTASDALDAVLGAASNPEGALTAYRVLFDLEGQGFLGEGSQAQTVRANGQATAKLFRGLAVAGAVRAAARISWPNLEAALEARAQLEAELDDLGAGTDDELNRNLAVLRLALVQAVPPPDETLPEIVSVTLPKTLPALVLAHQLYQDPLRDAEIVARNHVQNPTFVPGGRALAVLSS